jgi:NAD(P)-dependent dehydrogenase (short-subunit alcohol dehydrogenase family)
MDPTQQLSDLAIVTGAARGIGLAIAMRLARAGFHIVAMDMPNVDTAALQTAIRAAGREFVFEPCDVSNSGDWQRVIERVGGHAGTLRVLVNNAGIAGPVKPLAEYPESVFDQVMAVNVRGVFLGMQQAARAMPSGGSIVNIASVSGLSGSRNILAYTASKHAVVGMTKVAALELAQRGIRVNAVCPAPTDTQMVADLERTIAPTNPEAVRARLHESIPLRRYGTPDEIAAAVAWLCSAEAAFVTGTTLVVDGGMLAS